MVNKDALYNYAIVIVTYNRLELLKECIECARGQTTPPGKIVIVNNCSTDGTYEYLENEYSSNDLFLIYHSDENRGGSWGFTKGLHLAMDETDADWILLIDDDAMLDRKCMQYLNPNRCKAHAKAFACTVYENGEINTFHRRTRRGNIGVEKYEHKYFACNYASFCGLLVHREIVEKIGYPLSEYFIWFDDTEYCMRINEHTPIVVSTKAFLNHKVKKPQGNAVPTVTWKDFYDVRNQIDMYKRHRMIPSLIRKTLTSCAKGTLTTDKYKRSLYFEALRDGWKGQLGKNTTYCP